MWSNFICYIYLYIFYILSLQLYVLSIIILSLYRQGNWFRVRPSSWQSQLASFQGLRYPAAFVWWGGGPGCLCVLSGRKWGNPVVTSQTNSEFECACGWRSCGCWIGNVLDLMVTEPPRILKQVTFVFWFSPVFFHFNDLQFLEQFGFREKLWKLYGDLVGTRH